MSEYRIVPSELGECLLALRKRAGLSLSDVAKRAKVSRSYIWEVEQGTVNMTVGGLVKLANVYGIEPSEIVFRAEREEEKQG